MFCRTCGKQIIDEAVICPYCGCLTGVPQQPQTGYNNGYADKSGVTNNANYVDQYGNPINPNIVNINANNGVNNSTPDEINAGYVVLCILFPIVGIILGAINMSNGNRKSGKAYLIAGIATWAFLVVLGICLMGIGLAMSVSSY